MCKKMFMEQKPMKINIYQISKIYNSNPLANFPYKKRMNSYYDGQHKKTPEKDNSSEEKKLTP